MRIGKEAILVAVALMLGFFGLTAHATTLTVVDLGTMGGVSSEAYGLNASGDVVGSYTTSGGLERAFVWHDANGNQQVDTGEMQDMGTLGGTSACARAINPSGQVTGWATNAEGNQTAFLWTDANHDWSVQAGEMAGLGTLGGTCSRGYAINTYGVVAGLTTTANGQKWAFRWVDGDGDWQNDAGEMVNLGALGGTQSRAYGINSSGRVVGYAIDGSGEQQSFVWRDANKNKVVDSGELNALVSPSTSSYARDINGSNIVVGYFTAEDGKNHAYYSDGTTMYDVNDLIGGTWSEAYSISGQDVICGAYGTGTGETRAFMFDTTTDTFTDLTDVLTVDSGWTLTKAWGIEGDMTVGYGMVDGEQHAFITYVSREEQAPEPVTLVLLGSGAVMVLRRRRS